MPVRTGTNDKEIISGESFKAETNLSALKALIKFAIFQVEHSEPAEFAALREEWGSMLHMMQEKIDVAFESNAEIGYIAATFVEQESVH